MSIARFVIGAVGAASVLAALGAIAPAAAFPSGGHLSTPYDGSSFTSSCAGHNLSGFGFGQTLGTDLSTHGILDAANGPGNCSAATSSGVGTVTSNAADGGSIGNLGGSYNASASGSASAGLVKLGAQNTATKTQRFTGGAANGGWNDSYTVGGGSGQGLWVVPIHVSGIVNSQDQGTTAIFQIQPYVNGSSIGSGTPHNGAAFALYDSLNTLQNGDVISAWTYEMSAWGTSHNGTSDPLTQLAVNEIVQLVIPITYGAAVDLGIFAAVMVSERAQSSADGFAEADFLSTVAWLGPGHVFAWDPVNGIGAKNDNITVSAASGADYSQSFLQAIPEPAMPWLFALGVAGLAALRRRPALRPGPRRP